MQKGILYISFLLLVVSCTKVDIKTPNDFDVTTDRTTYSTTDTVVFNFSGNPGYITFYSGEAARRYEFSETTSRDADSAVMFFSTNTTAPGATNQPASVNNLSVLASTNFNGTIDSSSIKQATWTDISSRFTWATTTTSVSSKNVRVDDLKNGSNPLYIAFRYVADTTKTNYLPRKWQVASFGFKTFFKDVQNQLAGGASGTTNPFMTGGFQQKSILNSGSNWVYANANITFNAATTIGNLPDEDWCISRPLDLSLYISDVGVPIKNQTALLDKYKYKFTTAGTYVVSFVAKNADGSTAREVVKQITLTIQ